MEDDRRKRAREALLQARSLYAEGRNESALDAARQAVALFASAEALDPSFSYEVLSERAICCRLCGDFLFETEHYAEAAGVYQQAVDQYLRLDGETADQQSRRCAQRVLDCVEMLRARPFERLNLLIAQYEGKQRQFASEPGQKKQEAECAEHIARILQRRERYTQSVERFEEAIELYRSAPPTNDILLTVAECHHRAGGILAYRLEDAIAARPHLEMAINLYKKYEPKVRGRQDSREICERLLRELD